MVSLRLLSGHAWRLSSKAYFRNPELLLGMISFEDTSLRLLKLGTLPQFLILT